MNSYVSNPGSRFAEADEIIKTTTVINCNDNTLSGGGVPVLSDGSKSHVMNYDSHSITFGSTGSMKTRRIILPTIATLIKHNESIVVHDPKAEIAKRFSGLLEHHEYKVIILNFRDPTTGSCWNPLSSVYKLAKEGLVDKSNMYLRDIGMCIYSSQLATTQESFWPMTATDYWVGLGMLLRDEVEEEEFTIENIRLAHINGNKKFSDGTYLKKYLDYTDKNSETAANLNGTVYAPNDTKGGIHAVWANPMSLYSQDNLCYMMSRSDFELSTIGKEKTAVFLITPDERSQYNPIITMFIKQCYSILIDTAESEECNGSLPIRTNFVLDEFSNLPAVPDFSNMISAARSRNIRFNLIVQNLGQLYKAYSEEIAETIVSNCDIWHVLRSMDYRIHDLMQKMCGNHISEHLNIERPLIDTMTIQRLSKERGEVIISMRGQYPFITELPDIDEYSFNIPKGKDVVFKKRKHKKRTIFDLEKFVMDLVSGKKKEEQVKKDENPFEGMENLLAFGERLHDVKSPPTVLTDADKKELNVDALRDSVDALIEQIDKRIDELDKKEFIDENDEDS